MNRDASQTDRARGEKLSRGQSFSFDLTIYRSVYLIIYLPIESYPVIYLSCPPRPSTNMTLEDGLVWTDPFGALENLQVEEPSNYIIQQNCANLVTLDVFQLRRLAPEPEA